MNIFTYDSYKKLIREMKKISAIYTFSQVTSEIKNGIILRHDVDFDIERAYKLAMFENELSTSSSYFFLTTSDIYNPTSNNNRILIRDLHAKGFEIGLHFDPTIYSDISMEDMLMKVKMESSILEDIIGSNVSSISLHNPSIHGQYPKFPGYKNAYSDEFFNSDCYISDSCMSFRGKNILKFINAADKNLIQILLHPLHYSEEGYGYINIFKSIFKEKINSFDKSARINYTYKNVIGSSSLLDEFIHL